MLEAVYFLYRLVRVVRVPRLHQDQPKLKPRSHLDVDRRGSTRWLGWPGNDWMTCFRTKEVNHKSNIRSLGPFEVERWRSNLPRTSNSREPREASFFLLELHGRGSTGDIAECGTWPVPPTCFSCDCEDRPLLPINRLLKFGGNQVRSHARPVFRGVRGIQVVRIWSLSRQKMGADARSRVNACGRQALLLRPS